MKKLQYSFTVGIYLGNDTRQSHSYYVMQIGNRTQAFK